MEVIEKLIKMNGITIEIIGSFVWVSGNTKEHKDDTFYKLIDGKFTEV